MLPTTTASSNTLLLFLPSLPYLSLFPAQMFVRSTPHARFRSRQHVKARERRAGLFANHSMQYRITAFCIFSLRLVVVVVLSLFTETTFSPTPPFSSFLFVLSPHTQRTTTLIHFCALRHTYMYIYDMSSSASSLSCLSSSAYAPPSLDDKHIHTTQRKPKNALPLRVIDSC